MSTRPRDKDLARKNLSFLMGLASDASDGDHEDHVFSNWLDELASTALEAPDAPTGEQVDHVREFLSCAMDGHGQEGLNEAVHSIFAFLDHMAPAMLEDGEEYEGEDDD